MMKEMSDYVNGIKPYHFKELKGKVDILNSIYDSTSEIEGEIRINEISNFHHLPEESNDEITPDEIASEQTSFPEKTQLDMNELLGDISGGNISSNSQKKIAPSVKKNISVVWKQVFVKQVKDYLYPEILSRKSMTQENVIKIFDRKFLKQVPDCDKVKTETTRPIYHAKVHKLIYNNWIKSGLIEFHNGIYTVVKNNQA